jgi:glycosyltransferase involved in cell wall biosynthesis
MRILVLFAQHHWTGPADPELQKLAALQKSGHEITFCFTRKPEGSLKQVVSDYGFASIENVVLYRKRPALRSFLRDVRVLKNYCESWLPDIIHCHQSHDHWTGVFLQRKLNDPPPLVRTIHESRKLKNSLGDRLLHGRTDGFIVPSERFAKQLAETYNLADDALAVIGGVVDENRFRPGADTMAIRNEIEASTDAPVFGIVSRIKPHRGHALLIQAFRDVLPDFPSAKLMIVGRGELMETLQTENADLIEQKKLIFTGYRKDDLPEILNTLDFKLLLGEGSDGTCRAALEAMACATPVIAAEVGVLPETVTDGITGILVRPDDREYLTTAVRSALEHPHRMVQMGKNARVQILESHTIERAAEKMAAFYLSLMNRDLQ